MASKTLTRIGVGFIVPLIIGIIAAQFLGGLWFSDPFDYWEHRFRYITPDAFHNVDDFWTYRPNLRLRVIGQYKRPFGRLFVSSDCRYVTDANGFLDNPSEGKTYDILLLGDSFTAGEAGCSWVGRLRALTPTLSIYSAALPNTGVDNWAAEQRYLSAQGYRFKHVVAIFIADDFFRPLRQWDAREVSCVQDLRNCTLKNAYYPLEPGLDIEAAGQARAARLGFRDELRAWLKRNLWIPYFVLYSAKHLFTTEPPVMGRTADSAFDGLVKAAGSIQFVKVGTKDEVGLHADDAESIVSDKFLAGRHISYDRCSLSYDEFGAYDAHPNSKGYAHLARCVAATAGQFEHR